MPLSRSQCTSGARVPHAKKIWSSTSQTQRTLVTWVKQAKSDCMGTLNNICVCLWELQKKWYFLMTPFINKLTRNAFSILRKRDDKLLPHSKDSRVHDSLRSSSPYGHCQWVNVKTLILLITAITDFNLFYLINQFTVIGNEMCV